MHSTVRCTTNPFFEAEYPRSFLRNLSYLTNVQQVAYRDPNRNCNLWCAPLNPSLLSKATPYPAMQPTNSIARMQGFSKVSFFNLICHVFLAGKVLANVGFVCVPFIRVELCLILSVGSCFTRSRLCPDLVPNQTPIAAHAYHAWSVQTRICKTDAWCLLPTMFRLNRVVIPSAGIKKNLPRHKPSDIL